jgi:SAM-dependent methyltransferase
VAARVRLHLGAMGASPLDTASVDLVVAHGIWNLARSGDEFRAAVREAARVARPGAAVFVFTFSRHTLPGSATPVPGETFVFTQFSGEPQCFPTERELVAELGAAGFSPEPAVPFREHNRRRPGELRWSGPVIYEAAFRFGAAQD